MQFSETVLAAMIGAIATVSTALFQLFTVLRARNKLDVRPNKKGTAFRSIVAVIALMIASGVGGFLYAGMRQQSASEDLRNLLREELNAKLQLRDSERIAQSRETGVSPLALAAVSTPLAPQMAEAVVFASACQVSTGLSNANPCSEASAQRLMLCGAIPKNVQVRKLDLFAKGAGSQAAWEQSATSFEQDIGGAKFTGSPVEHPQDEHRKAICVDFMHWSSEAHLARVVIEYDVTPENRPAVPAPSVETTTAAAVSSTATSSGLSMAAPLVQ
jgi:hypothetical protein